MSFGELPRLSGRMVVSRKSIRSQEISNVSLLYTGKEKCTFLIYTKSGERIMRVGDCDSCYNIFKYVTERIKNGDEFCSIPGE
jgi:hypothetical protein